MPCSRLALALVLAWRRAEPVAAATAVVAASLLLSPNVLPWYALWLVPLLVLRDEPSALLFTGTIALAYVVYPGWQSGERWWLSWPLACARVPALRGGGRGRRLASPRGDAVAVASSRVLTDPSARDGMSRMAR